MVVEVQQQKDAEMLVEPVNEKDVAVQPHDKEEIDHVAPTATYEIASAENDEKNESPVVEVA